MHTSDLQTLEIEIDIEVVSVGSAAAPGPSRTPASSGGRPSIRHEGLEWTRRPWSGGPAYVSRDLDGITYHAWGGPTWTIVATDATGDVICSAVRRTRTGAFDVAATWASAGALF